MLYVHYKKVWHSLSFPSSCCLAFIPANNDDRNNNHRESESNEHGRHNNINHLVLTAIARIELSSMRGVRIVTAISVPLPLAHVLDCNKREFSLIRCFENHSSMT